MRGCIRDCGSHEYQIRMGGAISSGVTWRAVVRRGVEEHSHSLSL